MASTLLRSAAVAACLAAAAAVLTGSGVTGRPLELLQLNLCASGQAGCYTGRSVAEAATLLRAESPDVVTLNEICENHVAELGRVLADTHDRTGGGTLVAEFAEAPDRPSGAPTRCSNGERYGIGLLAFLPRGAGTAVDAGVYPMQDQRDPEERAWLCLTAPGRYVACTTHLASTNPAVALAQCRHLLSTTVPALHEREGYQPTVVAGDLNQRYGAAPDMRPCVPPGFVRLGEGGLQHILASGDFAVAATRWIDMRRTTDHPGLLVNLRG
jgi:hypothetical protein